MLNFGAKFLIPSILALGASSAYANIYSVTLSYSDQSTPDLLGTLSGFIVIDEAQFDGTENNTSGGLLSFPGWIQQASLTFTPNNGDPSVTQTTFSHIDWNVNEGTDFTLANASSPGGSFLDQVSRFGLHDGGDFGGAPASDPLKQQYKTGEFLLTSGVPVNAVPGPLPILGLGTFAWYVNSLKKKGNLNIKK